MIGANRVVLGNGIVHVVGDATLAREEETKLRRRLIESALQALQEGKAAHTEEIPQR
jgi:hypothetical protein